MGGAQEFLDVVEFLEDAVLRGGQESIGRGTRHGLRIQTGRSDGDVGGRSGHRPAVPILTALILPVVVAPVAILAVEALVDVPKLFVPALKVGAAVRVCACPSAASVAFAFGTV